MESRSGPVLLDESDGDGGDWEEELARLKALGAVEVDVGQGDQPWVVLADPEANEFCLLSERVE